MTTQRVMAEAAVRAARALALAAILTSWAACTGDGRQAADRQEAAAGGEGAAPRVVEVDAPLAPGAPVARPLAAGEALTFRFAAGAGSYVEVALDTTAIDVELALRGPDGGELAWAESRGGRWGDERLAALTEAPGEHRLEARPLADSTGAGELRLEIRDLRPRRPGDADRVAAERRFQEALRLYEGEGREGKERALALFLERAERALAADDARRAAQARFFAADTLIELARLDEALPMLEQVRAAWEALGDRGWQAETWYRIGNCHAFAGRYPEALAAYDAANARWEGPGSQRRRASTLNNQGFVWEGLTDYQRALDSYAAALELFRELGIEERVALGLVNVGAAYRRLGDPERALERYEQALPVWRTLGRRGSEALTLNNMAACQEDLGRPEAALELFRQALAIATELGDVRGQATYSTNVGNSLLALGQPAEALAACARGHELATEAGDERRRGLALICRGQARLAAADLEAAERDLSRAAELGGALGDREVVAEALWSTARLRRRQGRLEAALEPLARAQQLVEAVRTDVELSSLRAAFFSYRRGYYELEIEILAELARRRPGGGFEAAALAASERSRARGLLELLSETAAGLRAEVDPELLAEERRLRERINALALAGPGGDASGELERLLGEAEEVERRIRASHPGYAELALPRPPSLAELRGTVLGPRAALLEITLGAERSFLWEVTDDSLRLVELPPRDVLEGAARDLYEILADAGGWRGSGWRLHRERFDESARSVAGMIFGPLGRLPDREVLLVAAEGALSYLPFAALPRPGGGLLVEHHQVVQVPSAAVLSAVGRAARRRAAPRMSLLAFADPVFDAGDSRIGPGPPQGPEPPAAGEPAAALRAAGWDFFPRLRHSGAEVRAIAELLPPAERRVLVGFDATRQAVLDGDAGSYRLLHFATHGVLDSRRPRLSGLVLSLVDRRGRPLNGVLRLHDVFALELDADLVVLSACQTGLGREVRAEGLIGLTRGFLHAGARGVVASLWNVDDRATAELMQRLYRGILVDGRSPASALRQAQLELLAGAGDRAWRLPYYWAAFIFQGEWRNPARPALEPAA